MTILSEVMGTSYGETYTCPDCGYEMPLEVLQSGGGYYIGHYCPSPACGPWSRESGYYPTRKAAQAALESNSFFRI